MKAIKSVLQICITQEKKMSEDAKNLAEKFIAMNKVNNNDEVAEVCDQIAKSCKANNEAAFTSDAVAQQLTLALKNASNDHAIQKILLAIANITSSNPAAAKIFATPEMRDAIVPCAKYAVTFTTSGLVCLSFAHISDDNPAGQKLLSTTEVRDAIAIAPRLTTTAQMAGYVCWSIRNLCLDNAEGERNSSQLLKSAT